MCIRDSSFQRAPVVEDLVGQVFGRVTLRSAGVRHRFAKGRRLPTVRAELRANAILTLAADTLHLLRKCLARLSVRQDNKDGRPRTAVENLTRRYNRKAVILFVGISDRLLPTPR